MNRAILNEIFKQAEALSPEQLRERLLSRKGGDFSTIFLKGGFLDAHEEEYVQEIYGLGTVSKSEVIHCNPIVATVQAEEASIYDASYSYALAA